jgi:LasA protease
MSKLNAFLIAVLFGLQALVSVVMAAQPAPMTVTDQYFVWDTREFSLAEAIAVIDSHPTLAPHRALILDRLGFHSINPRLLPILVDLGDGLANLPAEQTAAAQRIDAFIAALAQMYHLGRAKTFATYVSNGVSAASVKVMNESDAGVRAIAETFIRGDTRTEQLVSTYITRFGVRKSVVNESAGGISEAAAPADFLRLPWTVGQTGWSFGGVHSNTGGCPNPVCAVPRAAIDFSRGWPAWGTSTADAPVLAAHDGTVTVFSSCNVRIANANGWATNYYHLANPLVSTGQTVIVGQPIANYADNMAQALCEGGSSTGPHVHFVLLQSGSQVPIDQSELSGWRINATNVIKDYDYDCANMWFARSGSVNACPYMSASPSAWAMHTLPTTMTSSKLCDLDIDGSGMATADRDGVLLLRYLSGFRGNALTDGIAQSGAVRTTAAQIETFIASKNYDLNLDGNTLASRDGLIAARYMQGGGSGVVAGGVGPFTGLLSSASGVGAYVFGCR